MKNIAAINSVKSKFLQHFAAQPKCVFQAPGRVNLIGEHTDYNDGFVLPCAIDYQTLIAASPREDSMVNVVALDYDEQGDSFDLGDPIESHQTQLWSNYVRGVIKHLQLSGHTFGGVNMVITGNVPQGAGLSSSASLEVAIGETFRQLYQLPMALKDVALNGQQAENQFVGCNCGIMDQMVSACGEQGKALLLDCRTLQTELISVPDDLAIMIINSNVKRGLVDSEYNLRRQQCEQAATAMGVEALRDADMVLLNQFKGQLDPVVYKRARHVISENLRTQAAARALSQSDYATLSVLMAESHASMRDDFEITVAPIDYIVEILSELLGDKGGVRMTGGGFGGCVVALMPHELVEDAKALIEQKYQAETGYQADMYICAASSGAGMV